MKMLSRLSVLRMSFMLLAVAAFCGQGRAAKLAALHERVPGVVGTWDYGATFDVCEKDGYLYLAAGGQVRIYDITTKEKLLALPWLQTDKWPGRQECGTYKEKTPPVKILHTGGFIRSLLIEGNRLYVANSKYLVIVDISKPKDAKILTLLKEVGGGEDVLVKDDYCFVTSGGIKVLDKSKHGLVKTLKLQGYNRPRRMALSGNYLYVACNTDHRLDIIDISNPKEAKVVGSYSAGVSKHSSYSAVAVKDNYAYVCEYHMGLRVIDVSDPANPKEVAKIIGRANQYNYNDIKIFGDHAFVSERYQGFDIIDISKPDGVSPKSIVKHVKLLPGYEEGIYISKLPYGTYAFLSANTLGLGIVDVTDVNSLKVVCHLMTPAGGDSVAVKGNYVYIGAHNEGVWVIDVSDPENPKERVMINNVGRNSGVAIQGNYLYVAGSWADLSVADISDPLNQKLIAWDVGPSIGGPLVPDGDYLYNGGLKIYDISNPKKPKLTYNKNLGFGSGAFVSVKYKDKYLLGGGQKGFFIVDVSDKANPKVVGKYATDLYTCSIIGVKDNIAYIGGRQLTALDISDVTNPRKTGSVGLIGNYVVVKGKYAYVSSRIASWGFSIVDISDPGNLRKLKTLPLAGQIVEARGLLFFSSGTVISLEKIHKAGKEKPYRKRKK